jgi:hypothetical protein
VLDRLQAGEISAEEALVQLRGGGAGVRADED